MDLQSYNLQFIHFLTILYSYTYIYIQQHTRQHDIIMQILRFEYKHTQYLFHYNRRALNDILNQSEKCAKSL